MLQGSEYASDSEHTRFLNMFGFWISLWFWIWQGSEYASGSENTRFLNMFGFWISLWFWIWQGSEYASGYEFARVTQGSKYVWICLNMLEYAWIYA